jgi:TIGR03009 family protein
MMRSWIGLVAGLIVLCLLTISSSAQTVQTPRNQTRQNTSSGQIVPIRQAAIPRTAASKGNGPRGVSSAAPRWFPLPPQHQAYLDEILTYWEHHCKTINRYECEFLHFVYGPTREKNGGRLKNGGYPALEKNGGIIKYMAPDKALYRTTSVFGYDSTLAKKYAPKDVERFGNHWICDGKAVFDFDYPQKKLFVDILPPGAQGKAIDRGPMPFLFRAKKDDLHRRFWMRVITPEHAKDEYWIEAVPKFQGDSAYFQMAHIIIAEKDYLPQAIVLFDPAYSPGNPKKQSYIFNHRKTNWSWTDAAKGLLLWQREFYEPKTPRGWVRVERNQQMPPPANTRPQTAGRSISRQRTGSSQNIGGIR